MPKGFHFHSATSKPMGIRGVEFSHSVKDYLEQKEKNIGDVCPVFEVIGVCKGRWRCRSLSDHIRKAEDGEEGTIDGWKVVVHEEVKFPCIRTHDRKWLIYITRNSML